VLVLNALLGLGTVLAPVFVAVFIGLGIWWALPVLAVVLLLALLLFSLPLPLQTGVDTAESQQARTAVPARFWLFAAFALLYGVCETLNGNWATLYMSQHLRTTAATASFALMAFWGMATVGRILFAAVARWLPPSRTYRLLPLVIAVGFAAIAHLPVGSAPLGILAFGLTGLGCSALLPLTISFGQEDMKTIASSVAGGLIAFYQMGYGIAAFGVGPLEDYAGLGLNSLFGLAAVAALMLAALSFFITTEAQPVRRAL
jgi:fucose permease